MDVEIVQQARPALLGELLEIPGDKVLVAVCLAIYWIAPIYVAGFVPQPDCISTREKNKSDQPEVIGPATFAVGSAALMA